MTEGITIRQAAAEATSAVPSGQQAFTVGARVSAERGKPTVSWAALLDEAVSKPGYIHQAYSRFWNYSLGNQLLALFQCVEHGIQPGPLASFMKWKQLGRRVKKGEHALTLCMPLSCTRTRTVKKDDGTEQDEQFTFTHFTYKNHWFVLSQTEGAEYQPPAIPEWSEGKALAALNIERIPFENLDGNTQGYARRGGKIAINPLAALPFKTFCHELAHCLLHCEETDLTDTDQTPRSVAEVEAEAVALLCCESLGLPGAEFSRGYIQAWSKGEAIREKARKARSLDLADYRLITSEFFARLHFDTAKQFVVLNGYVTPAMAKQRKVEPSGPSGNDNGNDYTTHFQNLVAKADLKQLGAWLLELALIPHRDHAPYSYGGDETIRDPLFETAKRWGVDAKAVCAAVETK